MNLMAKLKAMQREIDALRARVEALEAMGDPWESLPAVKIDPDKAAVVSGFPSKPGPDAKLIDGPVQVYEAPWPPLPETIEVAPPIASATIAPPPKKRGRPPKA